MRQPLTKALERLRYRHRDRQRRPGRQRALPWPGDPVVPTLRGWPVAPPPRR
jgi:hypothetical protein